MDMDIIDEIHRNLYLYLELPPDYCSRHEEGIFIRQTQFWLKCCNDNDHINVNIQPCIVGDRSEPE